MSNLKYSFILAPILAILTNVSYILLNNYDTILASTKSTLIDTGTVIKDLLFTWTSVITVIVLTGFYIVLFVCINLVTSHNDKQREGKDSTNETK